MNTDNLIVLALRNYGMDVVMYAVDNANLGTLEHSLTFDEVWANPALVRYIVSRAHKQSGGYVWLGGQQYSLEDYICDAIDWSLFEPEFVLKVLWEFKTKQNRMSAGPYGWRGTYMPWHPHGGNPRPPKGYVCSVEPNISDRDVVEARAWRREKLFRIPLPPHLLLAMCEFL